MRFYPEIEEPRVAKQNDGVEVPLAVIERKKSSSARKGDKT